MPESEKSVNRLGKEVQLLLGAGTATTARTLSFASFYILSDRAIHERLHTELADCWSKSGGAVPSFVELEKLPYLQALIKEALRYLLCI
jgi:cytochrome P450